MTDQETRQIESLSLAIAEQLSPQTDVSQLVTYAVKRLAEVKNPRQFAQPRVTAIRGFETTILPIIPFLVFLAYNFVKQKMALHLLKDKIHLATMLKEELGIQGKDAMRIVETISSADIDLTKLPKYTRPRKL